MKIIKIVEIDSDPYKQFGLGEDGELYSRFIGSKEYGLNYDDNAWRKYEEDSFGCSLRTMKAIVKEFAHLVIFT